MTSTNETPQIERRSNVSYEEFAQQYLYANCPVIVTDALRQWKALQRWTPDFFKQEFGSTTFSLEDDLKLERDLKSRISYGKTDPDQHKMSEFIDQVLASTEENPAPYLRNKVLYKLFPSLKDDIQPLPEYFQPNWLTDRYLLGKVGETLNRGSAIELYIGGKGTKFPVLHYDGAATHAFLMQIYGRKQYVIYHPNQERFLYPSPEKHNLSTVNDLENPDLEKFPLFAQAVPATFFLEPGELLFIPSRWWHTARIITPSITVSINTVNQSNWRALVDFVALGRSNPLVSFASRVYLTGAGVRRSWRDRKWRARSFVRTA